MTPIQRIAGKLRGAGRELKAAGSWLTTLCPVHADTNASLGIKEDLDTGKAIVKCFAGCKDTDVLKAIGLEVRDLFPEGFQSNDAPKNDGALTLAHLADAKKLPVGFLRDLGLKDIKSGVLMPYYSAEGAPTRARLRLALTGDERFRWGFRKDRSGAELKIVPYGLWRLPQARDKGNLIIVEGESDCWSAWYHSLCCLGLPGAETARLLELDHLDGIKRIYLIQEPDQGGSAFVNGIAGRLKTINWTGQAFSFQIGSGMKDLSDLHIATCDTPAKFRESVLKAIETALPMPEVQPKPSAAPQSPPSNDAQPQSNSGKPKLRNHEIFTYADKSGNVREGVRAIPIIEIANALLRTTENWPRRVEKLLFSDENGTVRYFEDRDDLFAWVQSRMAVYWAAGQDDADQRSLVSRAEFMSHLQATTQKYAAVEEMPHEPPMEGHYYAWRPPADYQATGKYLTELLGFFDNSETGEDRLLINAALMTPAWGGLSGRRPAIVIMAPDQGCGKSTLATAIGLLYDGHIELQLTNSAEDKLTSRLLTPAALSKRVVRIDNIKEAYDSAFIEGLITAPSISGHRLYHGEASRPNTLTFVLTGNALRLSRDIAERSFIIRLVKPRYRADWESAVTNFIIKNRDRILVDIIAELKRPPGPTTLSDRYADWVKGVLARCGGDTDAAIRLNGKRRSTYDDDQDEAAVIMAAIDRHNDQVAIAETYVFITSTQMTNLVTAALNEDHSAKSVKSKLESHIEAGRLPRVQIKRTNACKGYSVRRQEESENDLSR